MLRLSLFEEGPLEAHPSTNIAILQRLNTKRRMVEWKEAQKQRLENADTALEAVSARLQQKAGDIWGHASTLRHWLDDQQQSHDSDGASSAGMLSFKPAIAAAHAGWFL